MRFSTMPIIVVMFMLLGCSNETTTTKKNSTDRYLSTNSQLNTEKTSILTSIVQDYYNLKDAFVEDDEQKVDKAAKSLVATCKTLQTQIIEDTADIQVPSTYIDSIIHYSALVISINDKSIELKRVPFKDVSNSLYELLHHYKLHGITIYKQYCPLAFNDNGAYWLSNERNIQNPYFGKKMLECGEVVDIIE